MPDPRSPVDRVRVWNARFAPDLVRRKYAAMRSSAFAFFRGTDHLFFDDWPGGELDDAPSSWICGDLHLENFGVYKADNGLRYFDVNDFDEACLAPITRDVARFLTGILVGAPTWNRNEQETPSDARHWCHTALGAYVAALKAGRPHDVERELATGIVHKLFESARRRTRRVMLEEHTIVYKKRRRFVTDNVHIVPATDSEIALATALVEVATEQFQIRKDKFPAQFFVVRDVVRRVAGIGSLGARRYAVLVEGNGSPHRNVLLDLKEALPATAVRGAPLTQPKWTSEADRVVGVQRRVQGEPPAFLSAVTSASIGQQDGTSFIVRRLQPIANKLSLAGRGKHVTRALLEELACVAAWSHLRGVGWHGGPTVDACVSFASDHRWQGALLDYACTYAETVNRDYQAFCEMYDTETLGR